MSLVTKEISFCSGVAQNVVDVDFKVYACELLKAHGCNVLARHYIRSDDPKAIDALAKAPHFMATRTHGNAYFLLLTRYNDRNMCIFVDKKIQKGYTQPRMICVPLAFNDPSLYDGTVLDGELVRVSPSWVFLASDVMMHAGRRISSDEDFVARLSTMDEVLDAHAPTLCQPCVLQGKRYFRTGNAAELAEFASSLPYPVRGVVFKPLRPGGKDILLEGEGAPSGRFPLQPRLQSIQANPQSTSARLEGGNISGRPLSRGFGVRELPPHDGPSRHPSKVPTRTAHISKDNHPDCYIVTLEGGSKAGHLHVRSLEESISLYNTFLCMPAGRQMTMHVAWSARFNKWELSAARPVPSRRSAF